MLIFSNMHFTVYISFMDAICTTCLHSVITVVHVNFFTPQYQALTKRMWHFIVNCTVFFILFLLLVSKMFFLLHCAR